MTAQLPKRLRSCWLFLFLVGCSTADWRCQCTFEYSGGAQDTQTTYLFNQSKKHARHICSAIQEDLTANYQSIAQVTCLVQKL